MKMKNKFEKYTTKYSTKYTRNYSAKYTAKYKYTEISIKKLQLIITFNNS
jgi:hypothetical protein